MKRMFKHLLKFSEYFFIINLMIDLGGFFNIF
jgi:hypothetical protein